MAKVKRDLPIRDMYMWDNLEVLTGGYHSGGALIIVSDISDPEEAFSTAKMMGDLYEKAVYENPDRIFRVVSDVDSIFIYPDSGCC